MYIFNGYMDEIVQCKALHKKAAQTFQKEILYL